MTLEAMERTLARLDVMLDTLKRQLRGTADPRVTRQSIVRYQRMRADLEVQISLERIRRGTYIPRVQRRRAH